MSPSGATDSHCHLEPKDFHHPDGSDARDAVLDRARQAGVSRFVCVGSGAGLDEVRNAIGLAERHADLFAAIGIHPHDAAPVEPGALDEIARLAAHPRVVAIGETGLDYYYDHSPREAQKELFRRFVNLARRVRKPLSLHIRDAHLDAMGLLEEEGAAEVGGVVHCFTGGLEEARRYVALGLHISFSGIVTFKGAGALREAAAWVPEERLLVETDCPFLAPVPLRGKKNEPAYLVHTLAALAQLRGVPTEQLTERTSANAEALFRLH